MTMAAGQVKSSTALLEGIDRHELDRLMWLEHTEPHCILGAHPAQVGGAQGVIVRTFMPDAVGVECQVPQGPRFPLEQVDVRGLFAGFLPGAQMPLRYRLIFHFHDHKQWEVEDAYRFLPTLGELDLHLFNEGTHRRVWRHMGAHPRRMDGVEGTSFAVWAPNARRVSVVGDFNGWDGRRHAMRQMGSSGVFEIFVPGASAGQFYKYEIKTREGHLRVKSDPYAFAMEHPPGQASRIHHSRYEWGDREWIAQRPTRMPSKEPIAIYEVHLGSWARIDEEGFRKLSYRELAHRLVEHVKRYGFTHIELLPIAEHPFDGSWGYQVTGYYAPTSRYGTPEDFKYFVDVCHQNNIGVIVDWVPAHFPKDDFALRRFDGTALYEHEDPRLGEHPDWGTLIFNYGRPEVRNFLVANALFWFEEYHVDGLRVDAVASMLYLDYSRKEGEWIPNRYGGRENLDALEFLRATNHAVHEEFPGCITVAEESTAWPGVTRPTFDGGLGFTFKWNMGWMHDTLLYFSKDPVHRRYHHDTLTFAMLYEHTERFIMPLSHDEIVHGKRSLLEKMPGDLWRKFANLRLLLAYQFTRPGKKLLFMGTELAPYTEWNHDASLEWPLAHDEWRKGLSAFMEQLGRLYHEHPCLWMGDHDPAGFAWIDCTDRDNSVLCYWRRTHESHLVIVLNLTPVPREDYRIGAPLGGRYVERLSSDDSRFGGSGFSTHKELWAEGVPYHGYDQSLRLRLPPLGAVVLQPVP